MRWSRKSKHHRANVDVFCKQLIKENIFLIEIYVGLLRSSRGL